MNEDRETQIMKEIINELFGHIEMCNILQQQGIEPTEKNLDKHFPYRNVGCTGLECPNCGSKKLWVIKRKFRADFLDIDVDVFRCLKSGKAQKT